MPANPESMALLPTKLWSTALMLVLTFACCYLPWIIHRKWRKSNWLISLLNCMAGGVVLGALLMHMIPEMMPHDHGSGGASMCTASGHGHKGHSHHAHSHSNVNAPSKKVETGGPHDHDHSCSGNKCGDKNHKHDHNDHPKAFNHKHDDKESTHDHDHHHHDDGHKNPSNPAQQANDDKHNDDGHDGHSHKHGSSAGGCDHDHGYPWGPLAAGISFLFLFSIDRLFLSHAHCENETKPDTDHDNSHKQIHEHSHDHSCNHSHHHDHDHDHDHKHSSVQCKKDSSVPDFELSKATSVTSITIEGPHEDCHEADMLGGCHMEGIRTSETKIQCFIFVLALSMHSFLEGLGMATKNNQRQLFSFLVSLFAHKWIEAFALGVTVFSAQFSPFYAFLLITFYTILTPVGILLGIFLDWYSSASSMNENMGMVLNGLAAGSFLFVSCIEMIPPEFHTREDSNIWKFVALVFGFAIMAAVTALHSH